MNIKKYNFWTKIKKFSEKKMKSAWMEGGNCDSCCSKCKQWESMGNNIKTVPQSDGAEIRTCGNCGDEWRAIFTPAGFVRVD